jgi:hypothetical protein
LSRRHLLQSQVLNSSVAFIVCAMSENKNNDDNSNHHGGYWKAQVAALQSQLAQIEAQREAHRAQLQEALRAAVPHDIPVPSAAEAAVENVGEVSLPDIQANASGDGTGSTLTAGSGGSAGSAATVSKAPSTANSF